MPIVIRKDGTYIAIGERAYNREAHGLPYASDPDWKVARQLALALNQTLAAESPTKAPRTLGVRCVHAFELAAAKEVVRNTRDATHKTRMGRDARTQGSTWKRNPRGEYSAKVTRKVAAQRARESRKVPSKRKVTKKAIRENAAREERERIARIDATSVVFQPGKVIWKDSNVG